MNYSKISARRDICLVALLALFAGALFANDNLQLEWKDLPPLPDKFGFGGPIVGNHDGALIVAGGANFPNGPPWQVGDRPAGEKVWHDRVFVLLPDAKSWIEAGKLPKSLAYAPAISTADGIYILGGESFDKTNQATSEVLKITWNATAKRVAIERNALPPLPRPCRYHNAAKIGDVIYVTASHTKSDASRRLDVKTFWSLDLAVPKAKRRWRGLKAWPGPPRDKMALTVQTIGTGKAAHEALFMVSGANFAEDDAGEIDLTKFVHYADAYRFDPRDSKWTRIADLPATPDKRKIDTTGFRFDGERRIWQAAKEGDGSKPVDSRTLFKGEPRPAAAAVSIGYGKSHVLVFSGATGRYITLNLSQAPLFVLDVLAYDVNKDKWTVGGEMPLGVVTTGVTKWNGRIVIPNGEIRPGIRTNRVQSLRGD